MTQAQSEMSDDRYRPCELPGCDAVDSTRCKFKIDPSTGNVVSKQQKAAKAAGCRVVRFLKEEDMTQNQTQTQTDIRAMMVTVLEELDKERKRIQGALDAYDGTAEVDIKKPGASRPVHRPASAKKWSGRAKRGDNIKQILDYVAMRPGVTVGQISQATHIDIPVVYSATSRLAASGRLVREPLGNRQVGFKLP